jgi:riboflavin kinase/FMN adenylyltransferase
MKLLTKLEALPAELQGAVLVLGNFDGVHSGHQAMLREARLSAERLGRPLAVMTFEPHPRKLFRPDDPPFRITPPLLKRQRLELAGVDWLLELAFDWAFASQRPSEFIEQCLARGVQPSHILVGDDFRFGQLRDGSPQTLSDAGYKVTILERLQDSDGRVVSCTAIRQALQQGDIERANRLLGWQWEMVGRIERGEQRGRTLGYPTANVPLGDVLHPAYGVYAAWVCIEEDGDELRWLPSATNIGIRPMFEIPVGQIESFIFDFDRDVYGKTLRVRPVRRLRGEAKFESVDQLVNQMGRDTEQARAVLAAR